MNAKSCEAMICTITKTIDANPPTLTELTLCELGATAA